MEKMTLHKALGELKILDSRIEKSINNGVFITSNKNSNEKIDGMSIKDYEDKIIKSSYDKVTDLISRRRKIKDALTHKNSEIEFEVNNEKFTIATAIDRKNNLNKEKLFLNQLKNQYSNTTSIVNRVNLHLEEEALNEAQRFFENKDNVDVKKVKALQDDYIENRKMNLIDPLGIREKIEELELSIQVFEREIDYKLSELNAINFIEIE